VTSLLWGMSHEQSRYSDYITLPEADSLQTLVHCLGKTAQNQAASAAVVAAVLQQDPCTHMPADVVLCVLLHSTCLSRIAHPKLFGSHTGTLTNMRDLRGCPCLAATARASSSTKRSTRLRSDRRSCRIRHNRTTVRKAVALSDVPVLA
jgi:hypothetical protein